MTWIKRNLYFVIGGLVALLLMGAAGYYLYQKIQLDNQAKESLNQGYEELKRLYNAKPQPSDENIQEAQKQQVALRTLLGQARQHFIAPPPIPNVGDVRDDLFAAALRKTLEQLQRDAAQASVAIPLSYDFTFKAIKPRVTFARASLPLLAAQLGEVKALCDILYRARINSLESVRRERLCVEDDPQLAPADYLEARAETNQWAVLVPYEVNFRCFSAELAAVLDLFRQSPHGTLVKNLRIETAAAYAASEAMAAGQPGAGGASPAPGPVPGAGVAPAARTFSGPPIVINEKILRVSLQVDIVKPLPHDKE